MNVTLRPDGLPDVYIQTSGHACDLDNLEKQIRTLLLAKTWLKKELALKKAASAAPK
jgi:hypothetical protein